MPAMHGWLWLWFPGFLGFVGVTLHLVLWGLLIYLIVRVARGPARRPGSRALDVLDERYARGEIDRAEYLERRAVLLGERDETTSVP